MKLKIPRQSDTLACTTCSERRPGWFCSLSNHDVMDLEANSTSTFVPAKTLVSEQGEIPTHVHVVCSGFVKQTVRQRETHQAVVRVVGPGSALGLFAVMSNRVHEVSAQAITHVRLRSIERSEFLTLLSRNQELQRRVMQSLGQDYLSAHRRFCRTVLSTTVDERLNQLLHDMAGELATQSSADGTFVPLLLTQSEIATMIGTTRETVSRSLRELQKQGSILVTGSEMVLRQPTRQHNSTSESTASV